MAKIWAERILAGTRIFEKVPASLKVAVKENLLARLENGEISEEEFYQALGVKI